MRAGEVAIRNRNISPVSPDEPAALLGRFFVRVFGCRHLCMSRPVTLGGETYSVCLDCGARRCFDTDGWRMRGRYYF